MYSVNHVNYNAVNLFRNAVNAQQLYDFSIDFDDCSTVVQCHIVLFLINHQHWHCTLERYKSINSVNTMEAFLKKTCYE